MLAPSFTTPTTTQIIKINTSEIPRTVQDGISAATLDLVRSILSQPDGRQRMDAHIASKKEVSHRV